MYKNNIMLQYHYIPIYKFRFFKKKLNLKTQKNFIIRLLAYQYSMDYLIKIKII